MSQITTPINCAKTVVYLSCEELGRESPTMLVSRDFLNRGMFNKSSRFLKDNGYIDVSTKGTKILYPYNNLGGLFDALNEKYPNGRKLDPLPDFSKEYQTKRMKRKKKIKRWNKKNLQNHHQKKQKLLLY